MDTVKNDSGERGEPSQLVEKMAACDRRYLWHPFTQMAAWEGGDPLIIERGEGNELIGISGRRYIDGISSLWVNVHGHRKEEIDQAIIDQLSRIGHSTLLGLANVPSIECAEQIVSLMPQSAGRGSYRTTSPRLSRVFYSDSGSTATEIALKMAFQYWQLVDRPKKTQFIALEQAYHGDTIGAVSAGGIDTFHKIFHPLLFHCHRIPSPHVYDIVREQRQSETSRERAQVQALRSSLDALDHILSEHADSIAALIIEPLVQGAAGIIVHPSGFLQEVAKRCRSHDVLLICDEVATGFGRTGRMFACEHEDVVPDIMAVAKGLSGGYLPLAATIASESIYDAFNQVGKHATFFHGHSYTGNPLACAAAIASMRIFKEEPVIDHVNNMSAFLAELLEQKIGELAYVGDIRQCGLMCGIELVKDRNTFEPFSADLAIGRQICLRMREQGIILRNLGDVIVIMPPLSIKANELVQIVDAVTKSIPSAINQITR